MWWLIVSHLGAAMVGATVGVIVMALCAVSGEAARAEERREAGVRGQGSGVGGPSRAQTADQAVSDAMAGKHYDPQPIIDAVNRARSPWRG